MKFDFRKNISLKINLLMISIIVVLFLIIGIVEFQTSYNEISDQLNEDYNIILNRLNESLKNPVWDLDIDTINSILIAELQNKNIHSIAVIDSKTDQFLIGKMRGVDGEIIGLGGIVENSFDEREVEILRYGKSIAFIELELTGEFYEAEINSEIRRLIVQMAILIIVFSFVLSFTISLIVIKPIAKLAKVFESVAQGNLNETVTSEREDEIGQLGNAFNVMTSKLKESYEGLEEKVRIRTKELSESNKLKDLFTDIMRHDLLNPAGVVRTNSQLALADEKDVKKKEALEKIERSSNRMIRMIENASILAKLESGEKIEFKKEDLGVILKGAVEELSERAKGKNMKIKVNVEGKFPAIVNPLIQNVFSNFLSNSIKYSPEKTEIIAGIKKKNNDWLVYVEDRGEGIPAKYKKAIFERFTRLEKGAIKGSGLGLAISKKITEAHNGKIWVRDHKGGGSIFYVLIPKVHKKK